MVLVCSTEFERSGRTLSKSMGIPDLPFVIVPHPFTTLLPQEVEQLAKDRFNELVQAIQNAGVTLRR